MQDEIKSAVRALHKYKELKDCCIFSQNTFSQFSQKAEF